MEQVRVLSYPQVLLSLWLVGARVWREADQLQVETPSMVMTPELSAGIRRHKPKLLELAGTQPGPLALPAEEYWAMLWAPKPEWKYPYH